MSAPTWQLSLVIARLRGVSRLAFPSALLCAVATLVTGCGDGDHSNALEPSESVGSPSADVATTATSHPTAHPTAKVHKIRANPDAPTYASCEDLAQVFNSRNENQLSYLPEEHWLIVSPSSTAYKIDLINDADCVAANPALAEFVARFRAAQRAEQRGECRATLEQLKSGTFTVGGKTVGREALHTYAVSICEPLGIAVP